MRRAAGLVLLILATSGCGGHHVLEPTPPPTARGAPARNIDDVLFLTPRVGFLASSKGQFDHEPARIQRTGDGGRTWHDVWKRPNTDLQWIAFADPQHGFVGGDGFVLRTRDGGRTWTRVPMRLPRDLPRWTNVQLEPHFVTPALGFAVPDPAGWIYDVFLRTIDGGRTWTHVHGPKGVYDVSFVSPRTGFALGRHLYRTDDAGGTWMQLALPHVPYSLAAVDFLDARHGFVAGGWPAVTERGPSQAVFATRDGGRTWQRRYVNPHRGYSPRGDNPFARLRFVDARHGWATTGLCKCCPSGPCAGNVYVTTDGGYTWRRRGSEVELTTVGRRDAWAIACDFDCDVVWRTTDAGRVWRPIARPDRISLATVAVRGSTIVLGAGDGTTFSSTDGRTWTLSYPHAPPLPFHDVVASSFRDRRHGFAVTNHTYADESCGPSASVRDVGTRLYATVDGGRTWTARRAPLPIASVSAARGLVAAVGLRHCSAALALSRDGGRRWSVRPLPRTCATVSATASSLWIVCNRTSFNRDGDRAWTRGTILRSDDGGRSWKRLPLGAEIMSVAPRDSHEAWAILGQIRGDDLYRLWHTTDGGKKWKEVWPALPTRG
jgi:photosystem II stability/assembly factor-like uncharacterized protein